MAAFCGVKTSSLSIVFDSDRGLAVEEYIDSDIASLPIFGTLHHGTYDDISWGVDFTVAYYISPGHHQITDLLPCQPTISQTKITFLTFILLYRLLKFNHQTMVFRSNI